MRLLAISALLAPLVAASMYDHDLYARGLEDDHDLYARGFDDGQHHAALQARHDVFPRAAGGGGKHFGGGSAKDQAMRKVPAYMKCDSQCMKKYQGKKTNPWKTNAAGMNTCISTCMAKSGKKQ